jgi:hypothetical protein
MKKMTLIAALSFTLPLTCIAEKEGFQQTFLGETKVCNATAPYGCTEAFKVDYNAYIKYVQTFGKGTVVCNTTAGQGCQYNGVSYPAKEACYKNKDDNRLYCY